MSNQLKANSVIRLVTSVVGMLVSLITFILSIPSMWEYVTGDAVNTLVSLIIPLSAIIGVVGIVLFAFQALTRSRRVRKIKEKYPKLSIVGIMRERKAKQTQLALTMLFLSLLAYIVLPNLIGYTPNSFVIFVLALLVILLAVEKFVLDYRVRNGLYGNNEREAREIIQFITQEVTNIDFTDSGKLKSIISAEDLKEVEERVTGLVRELAITH